MIALTESTASEFGEVELLKRAWADPIHSTPSTFCRRGPHAGGHREEQHSVHYLYLLPFVPVYVSHSAFFVSETTANEHGQRPSLSTTFRSFCKQQIWEVMRESWIDIESDPRLYYNIADTE